MLFASDSEPLDEGSANVDIVSSAQTSGVIGLASLATSESTHRIAGGFFVSAIGVPLAKPMRGVVYERASDIVSCTP
ncbi:hypothetical protein JJE66_36590 [Bradyrhizobium diazoefficiens]|uniref:hypothetical protein n=1 Tax=Bradyrhizobium diazoefficiens TaxID=1355477 RepID=UPI001909DE4D|nr:hypothetical protein [Bradyrhizobium diazoefficiens]MBK3666714.1 hypothetical protein [Bradyrhizobium diazoefficiens]